MGINDAGGNPIRYRDAALDFLRALVEWDEGDNIGDAEWTCGDIGFDGYAKGGNTWNEQTGWASALVPDRPQYKGPRDQHIDYNAPSYFHCFAEVLNAEGDPAWNVDQFRRGEASSDWLIGQHTANGNPQYPGGWLGSSNRYYGQCVQR